MPDKCPSHNELVISITRVEGKVDHLNDLLERDMLDMRDHVKESSKFREKVLINTGFRQRQEKWQFAIWMAILSAHIKAWFFGGS